MSGCSVGLLAPAPGGFRTQAGEKCLQGALLPAGPLQEPKWDPRREETAARCPGEGNEEDILLDRWRPRPSRNAGPHVRKTGSDRHAGQMWMS